MASIVFIVKALVISIVITIIFEYTKRFRNRIFKDKSPKQQTMGIILGFMSVLFTLLVVFTINNYITRYYLINQAYNNETTYLQLVYRAIKDLPDSEPVINDIKKYIDDFINIKIPLLRQGKDDQMVQQEFRDLTEKIIQYSRKVNDPLLTSIIGERMVTETYRKNLNGEAIDLVYISIIIVVAILTLISFWFVDIGHGIINIVIDFCVITAIVFCVYLIIYLNNPLKQSPIMLSLDNYHIFRDELN